MSGRRLSTTPLHVVVRKGSKAAHALAHGAGIDPRALAPGLPPTPAQDLRFHGGKTIPDLAFVNLYVAGATSWATTDMASIDRALEAAMSDANLNNVMMQYFGNRPISSAFGGSRALSGDAPAVVSQGDAEALVGGLADEGSLTGFDPGSTVINLLLPQGTILTTDAAPTGKARRRTGSRARAARAIPHEDTASSEDGLGGYHGSVHRTVDGVDQILYYAIGVYSEVTADGRSHGIPAFPDPWKSVVATFYHELNEARTDPDVEDAIRTNDESFLGWTSAQGEECGDFPIDEAGGDLGLVFQQVPLADGSGVVPVQLQYSNAVHGPEGPIPAPHGGSAS
jgi:hypothetical protein